MTSGVHMTMGQQERRWAKRDQLGAQASFPAVCTCWRDALPCHVVKSGKNVESETCAGQIYNYTSKGGKRRVAIGKDVKYLNTPFSSLSRLVAPSAGLLSSARPPTS